MAITHLIKTVITLFVLFTITIVAQGEAVKCTASANPSYPYKFGDDGPLPTITLPLPTIIYTTTAPPRPARTVITDGVVCVLLEGSVTPACNEPPPPPYAKGWCGLHVTQFQKPDPSKDPYSFEVHIFDADQKEIGSAPKTEVVPQTPLDVTSKLPYVFILIAGNVDKDAVLFRYADQAWGSNDQEHFCNFGAYDNGKREGDCGFSC